jgi:predicted secreted hydrolase
VAIGFLAVALFAAPAGAEGPFRQALPGYEYRFPRDFFSHDDYRIEWWYYTGNLKDKSGRAFGYQLTFFRVGLEGAHEIPNPSTWAVRQIYFAHLTVSDIAEEKFYFFERINRKGLVQAGAESDRLLVWNENWRLTEENGAHRLTAMEAGTGVDLLLKPAKPLVFHGKGGISRKGDKPGSASHYFSYTRMPTAGTVSIAGRAYEVEGTSWMDREFSSSALDAELAGWDWFSLKLDSGHELMLYQLRRQGGGTSPYSSGTRVEPGGAARHLAREEFSIVLTDTWTSPNSQITYPSGWLIELPGEGARLEIVPEFEAQELYDLRSISGAYWEGSVRVTGTFAGRRILGRGYVELVGYGRPLVRNLPG